MKEKAKPHININHLPEQAKEWLEEHFKMLWQKGLADPKLGPIYKQILEEHSALHKLANSPEPSISTFRDIHIIEYPERSTGCLPISNEQFSFLIWHQIYDIAELEKRLAQGTFPIPKARLKSKCYLSSERFQEALQQYHNNSQKSGRARN